MVTNHIVRPIPYGAIATASASNQASRSAANAGPKTVVSGLGRPPDARAACHQLAQALAAPVSRCQISVTGTASTLLSAFTPMSGSITLAQRSWTSLAQTRSMAS